MYIQFNKLLKDLKTKIICKLNNGSMTAAYSFYITIDSSSAGLKLLDYVIFISLRSLK